MVIYLFHGDAWFSWVTNEGTSHRSLFWKYHRPVYNYADNDTVIFLVHEIDHILEKKIKLIESIT